MKVLVCGAGGFIAGHLVARLKEEGDWVRGVDIKEPEFGPSARRVPTPRPARPGAVPGRGHRRRRLRRGVPTRRRHGWHGVHPLRRVRDHAQQRADQPQHGRRGRRAGDQRLLLLLVGLHLPGHGDRRAGADRGRRLPRSPRQRVRLGEALRRARGPGLRPRLPASRYASPASRTATAPRAPGRAAGRRRRPPSAAKWPRSADGGDIEVWGDGSAVRSYIYVDDMVDGIVALTPSDLEAPGQHRHARVRHSRRAGRRRRRRGRQGDRAPLHRRPGRRPVPELRHARIESLGGSPAAPCWTASP